MDSEGLIPPLAPSPFFLHTTSICIGFLVLVSYISTNYLLQLAYYRSPLTASTWKCQPKRGLHSLSPSRSRWPWLPSINPKPHWRTSFWMLATWNMLMAAAVAAVIAELTLRGQTSLVWTEQWTVNAIRSNLCWVLAAHLWHQFLEYWWHRGMHQPFLYKRMHKVCSPSVIPFLCI